MKIPASASYIWSDGKFFYLASHKSKYKFPYSLEGFAQAMEQVVPRPLEPEPKEAKPVYNNHPVKYSLKGPYLSPEDKATGLEVLRKVGLIP